jgi:hypothetical protein
MKARQISRLLFAGAAISLAYGTASSARADDVSSADPFASVEAIEKMDLEGLRGADIGVLEVYEKNVKTTAKNQATNTTNVTIDTSGGHSVFGNGGNGGSVIGGNVSYSDNALQNFGGVYTSAINTAPGGIASALTGVSITINP